MYTINAGTSTISNDSNGSIIRLGEFEFKLLETLINHHGSLLPSNDLIEETWGSRYVGSGSLKKAISSLRYTFKDYPPYKIIINKPRRGYYMSSEILSQLSYTDH